MNKDYNSECIDKSQADIKIQRMLVISILTVVCFVLHTADCSCDLGSFGIYRFGPDCRFMCHCKNNEQCDDNTGECSSGCANFWYGPGCQYRDVAEGEFSRHSDDLDSPHQQSSNLANDGNSETCSYTAEVNSKEKKTNPFWRVWLPTTERISELIILTKVEKLDHFKGFEVYVENVTANVRENNEFPPKDSQKCYRHTGDAIRNENIKVLCENPVVGNQVRIQLGTFRSQLVLCDVKINGGRNLAFDRDISQTQSSGFSNPASNAVDGHDRQSVWTECSYTSRVDNPSLKLGIGRNALIWFIRILPYKSIHRKINENLRLQLADDKTSLIEKTVDIFKQTQSANITLNTAVARYVTITNPGKVKSLQICELKVFGDCLENECGFDCSKTCHCKYTNIWDKMDGKCSSGCKHGWTGESCDPCLEGLYGSSCQQQCSQNCLGGNEKCDHVNGICSDGCVAGWKGEHCDTACEEGRYGKNCSQQCSENCLGGYKYCSGFNGTCSNGCRAGWKGTHCDGQCTDDLYGSSCQEHCSQNCLGGNEKCDHVDGTCIDGCVAGWKGNLCDSVCGEGWFGKNCLDQCSKNCLDGYEDCNRFNGSCLNGCMPGWKGSHCDEPCPRGFYGSSCQEQCSQNCLGGNGKCNHVDGTCSDRCVAGWKGERCDTECPDGKYGQNCAKTCSQKCNDGLCDNVDGKCIHGCKPGYVGTNCEQKCSDGYWGPDCISVCGHCADSSTCSIYTGTCPGACRPGWLQPLCIYAESHVEKDGQFRSVDIIIGPTVAVVTGVAVIITLLLVLKRRNSLKPEKQLEANDGTSAQDINEYERIDLSRVDVEHETQYTELQLHEYEQGEETVLAGPK